jgi:hypothetical protein
MAIVQQLRVDFETGHVTAEITSFPWDCPGAVTHQALSGHFFKSISVEGRVSAFKTFAIYATAC